MRARSLGAVYRKRVKALCSALLIAAGALFFAGTAAAQQAPPAPEAAAFLAKAQSFLLQRTASTKPFHLRLALTEVRPDGRTVATGSYEETWTDPRNWHREATLGTKHAAEQCTDGERGSIPLQPLDSQGATLSDIARWELPLFDADADSAVMQHIHSHVNGRDVPMVRIGTEEVLPQQPFKPDAMAWFFPEGESKLIGAMDGTYFVQYFERREFLGRFAPADWSVAQDTHVFLKAKLVLLESAK